MFDKLALKYKVPNPVREAATAIKPAEPSSIGWPSFSSSASSSPFSSMPAATCSSPFTSTPTAPSASPLASHAAPTQPDNRDVLTKFYQQHNPSKIGDVEANLTKYKVSLHLLCYLYFIVQVF
jgi:hypothetical protein